MSFFAGLLAGLLRIDGGPLYLMALGGALLSVVISFLVVGRARPALEVTGFPVEVGESEVRS